MDYHNENDPNAAAWLRELIRGGHIPPGHVDERSIVDVRPSDLIGYTRCHFFSGIGGWAYALRLAGVPDSYPCWTGSCPCQPWSHANVGNGGGRGRDDERHLAPIFARLIRQCSPSIIFGEQVPGAVGKGWLDEFFTELESKDYACGALVLPASAFGADHERKRLFWVANSGGSGLEGFMYDNRIHCSERWTQPIFGACFAEARHLMEGGWEDLLFSDGVSVGMDYGSLKSFGNAIVPQVAAEFIRAAIEAINNAGK